MSQQPEYHAWKKAFKDERGREPTPYEAWGAALSQPAASQEALTDAQVDQMLSASIPGGSAARDWFLPHESAKGLANVRDVVRLMLRTHPQQPSATGGDGENNALAVVTACVINLATALRRIDDGAIEGAKRVITKSRELLVKHGHLLASASQPTSGAAGDAMEAAKLLCEIAASDLISSGTSKDMRKLLAAINSLVALATPPAQQADKAAAQQGVPDGHAVVSLWDLKFLAEVREEDSPGQGAGAAERAAHWFAAYKRKLDQARALHRKAADSTVTTTPQPAQQVDAPRCSLCSGTGLVGIGERCLCSFDPAQQVDGKGGAKPMTFEQCANAFAESLAFGFDPISGFEAGIKAAERFHGIAASPQAKEGGDAC